MNKPLALIVSFLLFCGCAHKSNVTFQSYDDTITIIPFEDNTKQIPPDMMAGTIVEYVATDSIEQSALNALKSYNQTMLMGDVEGFIKYIYPNLLNYYKSLSPNEFDNIHELVSDILSKMTAGFSVFAENGISYKMVVTRRKRKVSYNNAIIYVFGGASNVASETIKTYSLEEEIAAISTNSGNTWTFMSLEGPSQSILSKEFPKPVVDYVLGYTLQE